MLLKLAISELEFFKDHYKELQKIEKRLKEIEEEYLDPPHRYVEEETGLYMILSASVEEQVIWKLEVEQALNKMKNRILERNNRIITALNQLEQDERDTLILTYLDDIYSIHMQWLLTYLEMEPIRRKIRIALIKFYRNVLKQRRAIRKANEATARQQIEDKVKQYIGSDGDL